jgi:hypothetical protein
MGMLFPIKIAGSEEPAASETKVAPAKVEYKSENLRDPFRPERIKEEQPKAPTEKRALPSLDITGMVWGGKLAQAIINNKVVKAGDIIDGEVRIIDVGRNGVTILFDNQQYTLPMLYEWSSKGFGQNSNLEGGKHE